MSDNKMLSEKEIEILRQEVEKKKKSVEALTRAVNTLISIKQELNEKNEILAEELKKAKEGLVLFKKEIEALTAPPNAYGFVIRVVDLEKRTVDVFFDNREGRRMVTASPAININDLKFGAQVRLNEGLVIIAIDNALPLIGSEAYFDCWIDKDRLRATEPVGDEKIIVFAVDSLPRDLDIGDALRIYGGFAFEKLPKIDDKKHFLIETPTVTFENIGGLDKQIIKIREWIEWPYLHKQAFKEHDLKPPKGILLYGAPGCGKTLIAKCLANNLAKKAAEIHGGGAKSYFINIKGPELLNKYVGNTEQAIREIFSVAKKLANEKVPVIMFWDDFEGLFRTRGTGVSSDIQDTIVPQFITEMDGVEELKNVIIIAATNRQDRIDPAVTRAGRFTNKIEIPRPNQDETRRIFQIYLKPERLLLHNQYFDDKNYDGDFYIPRDRQNKTRRNNQGEVIKYLLKREPALITDYLINATLDRIFDAKKEENQLVQLIYENGEPETICYSDLISGATIEDISNKAKWNALRDFIQRKEKGLNKSHLMDAIEEEFSSQEKLPNMVDPNEWANILGKRKHIIRIRSLAEERKAKQKENETKKIETVPTGHYL